MMKINYAKSLLALVTLATAILACKAPDHLPTLTARPLPTLTSTAPRAPTPANTPVLVTVKQDFVYFRTCPARTCAGVPLDGGTVLALTGACAESGGITWAQAQHGDVLGWISAAWITGPGCPRSGETHY